MSEEEEDGYCEFCDSPNPTYKQQIDSIIYLFCDKECAEEYLARF